MFCYSVLLKLVVVKVLDSYHCMLDQIQIFLAFANFPKVILHFFFHLCSRKITHKMQCRQSRVSCKISSLAAWKELFSVDLLEVRVIVVQSEQDRYFYCDIQDLFE